jgi:hypothetical protein
MIRVTLQILQFIWRSTQDPFLSIVDTILWIPNILHLKDMTSINSSVALFFILQARYKIKFQVTFVNAILYFDRLCGLVVRVLDYRCRGPGFDSRALPEKK